ncbi:MAG: DoxX family protein [Acidimicrobiales bacterium]|nr:DoxX family protein [Acidimicrobiales bacterium]
MTIAINPTRAQSALAKSEAGARVETHRAIATRYVGAAVRVSLGFTFLWAFADKMFGWGKATPAAKAWIEGGSPTTGFLSGATGPFADTFHSMAGSAWADWLFMAGLLGVGVALTLGIGMRIAAASGGLLLVFMWAASLPLENNPFMDDHLVYAMVLAGLALVNAGDTAGLGRVWSRLPIVGRLPFLR